MALKISISEEELLNLTDRQLDFFKCSHSILPYLGHVLNKMDRCYALITNKYYHWMEGGGVFFSLSKHTICPVSLFSLKNCIFER